MNHREFTIDFSDPVKAATGMIELMKLSLVECRGVSDKPDELEWEIRLYDYLFVDPVARLAAYRSVRMILPGRMRPKRECVKLLGWVIP